MRFQVLLIAILAMSLAGCSAQLQPYERGLTPDQISSFAEARFTEHHRERDFVQGVLGSVQTEDRDTLILYLAPGLISPTLDRDMDGFFSNFPSRAPQRVDMVGYHTNLDQQTGSPDRLTLNVEYVFDYEGYGPVFLTVTGVADGANSLRIINLNSQLLEVGQWQPRGALGSIRQSVRVLAIASPIILLIALAVWMVNARRLRRRLIWLITLLATSPTFAFNWASQHLSVRAPALSFTDGVWSFDLVEWIPLGIRLEKTGDYSPWIITVGLPVGALFFLFQVLNRGVEFRDQGPAATSRPSEPDTAMAEPTED